MAENQPQTIRLTDPASPVDVTIGLTERHQTPYIQLGFPNLVSPHNEGPTLLLYGDDAKRIAAALDALHRPTTNVGGILALTPAELRRIADILESNSDQHGFDFYSAIAAMEAEDFDDTPADNAASVKPDYVWRDPSGIGWIDAWNGWYETLEQALADTAGAAARGEPWVLAHGQGLITEAERDNADPERNAT